MKPDDRFTVRAGAPPAGASPESVAQDLGWRVADLMGHIERGSLPAPDIFRGRYLFPLDYALRVRCDGLRLPGTYPGLIPIPSRTKAKARAKAKRKGGGYKRPRPTSRKSHDSRSGEGGAP